MRAIVQNRYGPTDVLQFRDVDPPTPGVGEVLVHVRAAGKVRMEGKEYVMRDGDVVEFRFNV